MTGVRWTASASEARALAAGRDEEISAAEMVAVCLLAILTVLLTVLPTFYSVAGREYPEALPLVGGFAWATGVWAWLYAYTARHRIGLPMDAGWFVFVAWWVLVPYYLFRARRWRALIPLAAFGSLWAAAQAVAWLLWMAAM